MVSSGHQPLLSHPPTVTAVMVLGRGRRCGLWTSLVGAVVHSAGAGAALCPLGRAPEARSPHPASFSLSVASCQPAALGATSWSPRAASPSLGICGVWGGGSCSNGRRGSAPQHPWLYRPINPATRAVFWRVLDPRHLPSPIPSQSRDWLPWRHRAV